MLTRLLKEGKHTMTALHPGDSMLVKNLSEQGGTGKLRSYWEDTIHTVVRQVGTDIAIYKVKPETGKEKSRISFCHLVITCHSNLQLQSDQKGRHRIKGIIKNPVYLRKKMMTHQMAKRSHQTQGEYQVILNQHHRFQLLVTRTEKVCWTRYHPKLWVSQSTQFCTRHWPLWLTGRYTTPTSTARKTAAANTYLWLLTYEAQCTTAMSLKLTRW